MTKNNTTEWEKVREDVYTSTWRNAERGEHLVCKQLVQWLIAQAKEEGRREGQEDFQRLVADFVAGNHDVAEQARIATITLFEEEIDRLEEEDIQERHNIDQIKDYQSFVLGYQRATDDLLVFADSLKKK